MKKTILILVLLFAFPLVLVSCSFSKGDPAEDFKYSLNGDTITIFGYTGNKTEVVIPEKIEGKRVTLIGAEAFMGNDLITSITIPKGNDTKGEAAFFIGDKAFWGCNMLKTVNFPKGFVKFYGKEVFFRCSMLSEETKQRILEMDSDQKIDFLGN
ncbi:MAG: leucine-rich repeat domain-containing protein [Oscillospiraceae bacterium]|nr:leucine-rich repeat domain-containing protein [Oscillospiraceae bacterium]